MTIMNKFLFENSSIILSGIFIFIIFYFVIPKKKIGNKFGMTEKRSKRAGIIIPAIMIIFAIFEWLLKSPNDNPVKDITKENYVGRSFMSIITFMIILLLAYFVYSFHSKRKAMLKNIVIAGMPTIIVPIIALLISLMRGSNPPTLLAILFTIMIPTIIIVAVYYSMKNIIELFKNIFGDDK